MSASSYHMLLIKNDGTLWSWGKNVFGQLGHGDKRAQEEPKQIGNDKDWGFVAAVKMFSFAIKKDGTLWAWGEGFDPFPKKILPGKRWKLLAVHEDVLVTIAIDETVHASKLSSYSGIEETESIILGPKKDKLSVITAGYRHFVGVAPDGSLWSWGNRNDMGQLGLGTKEKPLLPEFPQRVGQGNDWLTTSSKNNHTLAIKIDGTLWAWGFNTVGQVGNGSKSRDGVLQPVQVGTNNDWSKISAGDMHSIALKIDGTLWGWGMYVTEPIKISTENTWVDIHCGQNSTYALKKDDTLWHFKHSTKMSKVTPQKVLNLISSKNTTASPDNPENKTTEAKPNTTASLSEATKDKPFINSLGMKFVPIPDTGQFFSVYETRISEYKIFVVESGIGFNLGSENDPTKPNHPVRVRRNKVFLSKRANAEDFCQWLTVRERQQKRISKEWEYRLPTVAEWKAATDENLHKGKKSFFGDKGVLKPVGSGRPNKYGIFDMAGNAWELTLDNMAKDLPNMVALVGGTPNPRPTHGMNSNGPSGLRCILAKGGTMLGIPKTEVKKGP